MQPAWMAAAASVYTPRLPANRRGTMEFWSRRPSLAVAAGIIVWLASVALAGAQAPKPQISEEVFKNVQVLKGIPVDEFMGTMGLFSASLSMCCAECHTGAGTSNPKWEDDPPRK